MVLQWDLGEFDQKGAIATRWGTKEQLVSAIATARAHGIDVLIDAVLNVRISIRLNVLTNEFNQHKLGADRVETFDAVAVDIKNRLKDLGPAREIEVRTQSQ